MPDKPTALRPSKRRRTAIATVTLFLLSASAAQTKDRSSVVKDFEERVQQYLETHKQTHVAMKPSDSPAKVEQQKQQASRKIQQARPEARQGDIFTSGVSAYFRERLALTLESAEGPKIRASLRRAEPLPNIRLKVNSRYPASLPLQSTPPTLIANLPRLPGELQYRIVGQTLVLYDLTSDLIVDLLPNAIPNGGNGQ